MIRLLPCIVILICAPILAACSDSSGSDPADVRCASATKAVTAAKNFERKLAEQDPEATMEQFYADLSRGKVGAGMGSADTRQKIEQLISDSPTCFSVVDVADARRTLKLLDPAIAEATGILLSGQRQRS